MSERETDRGLQPIRPHLRQLVGSSNSCGNGTPPLNAAKAAAALLGCYRRDDAADPETYATAVAAVLSTYPPEIVKRITDPRTGLAGRSKFLPTVSEIREECERIASAEAAAVERNLRIERQLAERKADDERRASQHRPTLEELKAKHGPNWGLSKPEEDSASRNRQLERIQRANEKVFARECEQAGLDPAGWCSPTLVDLVRRQKDAAA
jgi:hypothetical protein